MVWILLTFRTFSTSIVFLLLAACSSTSSLEQRPKSSQSKSHKLESIQFKSGPSDNNGNSFFQDKTSEYGLAGYSATQLYAVDFDADGLTDLVLLPAYYSIPQFLKFDGEKFTKIDHFPFDQQVRASFMLFLDINRDGLLDVILATLNQKSEVRPEPIRLYYAKKINGKLHYEYQASAIDQKERPVSSIAAFDMDLDGDLDLYLANWFTRKGQNHLVNPDEILEFDNGVFSSRGSYLEDEYKFNKEFSSYVNAGASFGVGICDFDLNGRADVMVSASSGYNNKLWMNFSVGKKSFFKDYGNQTGFAADLEGKLMPRGGGNSFFSICTDYNNDGAIDVYQGELFHAYDAETRDRSSVLTGKQLGFPPSFFRTEIVDDDGTDTWTQGDRRGSWIDYNNDGLVDIVIDNSGFPPQSRLLLFEQLSDHAFVDVAKNLGINILNPSGTVVLDVNNDGFMDILSAQSNVRNSEISPRLYLFENQIPFQKNRSLRVYLDGKKANPQGIGATIKVKTSNSVQTRIVEFSNGPLPSQNEEGVHFGLGTGKLKQIEVIWPINTGRGQGKVVRYNVEAMSFKKYLQLTLCENGVYKGGKKRCAGETN